MPPACHPPIALTCLSFVYPLLFVLCVFVLSSNQLTRVLRAVWADVGNNWLYAYAFVLERWGSDALALGGTALFHMLSFWPLALLFAAIDSRRAWAHYKIQPGEYASRDTYQRCARQVLLNQLVVGLPTLVVTHWLMEWRTGGTYTSVAAWPSFAQFVGHTVLILLVEELLFYHAHRAAHWGPLYALVHKKHHEFRAPVASAWCMERRV